MSCYSSIGKFEYQDVFPDKRKEYLTDLLILRDLKEIYKKAKEEGEKINGT